TTIISSGLSDAVRIAVEGERIFAVRKTEIRFFDPFTTAGGTSHRLSAFAASGAVKDCGNGVLGNTGRTFSDLQTTLRSVCVGEPAAIAVRSLCNGPNPMTLRAFSQTFGPAASPGSWGNIVRTTSPCL